MHRIPALIVLVALSFLTLLTQPSHAADEKAKAKPTFELKDGDRIAFVGNTFIEREQQSGYIELALTLQHPDKHITFRNLGWSGDNVFGESRARFGSVQDGFKHLIDNAKAVKPTVLIVSYGHNAAFAGEAGIGKFIKGYERLLDTLVKETKARVILVGPHKQENMGPPLPDPSQYNQYLVTYSQAVADLATKRGHAFFDLSKIDGCSRCVVVDKQKGDEVVKQGVANRFHTTDNGVHFTPFGYFHVASVLLRQADLHPHPWRVRVRNGKAEGSNSMAIDDLKVDEESVSFSGKETVLPLPIVSPPSKDRNHVEHASNLYFKYGNAITVDGMKPGKYEIRIDGQVIATASASDLKGKVLLFKTPQLLRVEKLRQTIVEKNELFFHRWRPANETYIYLFRKHEQGNNAKEMPMFDPLIEAKEKEIAKLRKPGTHKYEIVRVGD